jgi:RING finger protein 113A
MFKKRVVKTGNEAKRKLDHDVDSGSDAEITHNNDEINLKRTKYRRHEVSNSNGGKNIMVATAAQEVRDDDNDKTKPEPETVVKPKLVGPKPVAANIRTTTITDFQPDVCKDFLKNGYCGYGDTCKFLHIREELKQKKPLEKDWEVGSKKSPTEAIGDKCVICEQEYSLPVKTDCGHVYCKTCFLTRYKTKPECFICGKQTNGIMKPLSSKQLANLISPT